MPPRVIPHHECGLSIEVLKDGIVVKRLWYKDTDSGPKSFEFKSQFLPLPTGKIQIFYHISLCLKFLIHKMRTEVQIHNYYGG
jgi:hypothetical protein